MTRAELAQRLGVSRTRITLDAKRGMPTDDVGAAMAWRAANLRPSGRGHRRRSPNPEAAAPPAPPADDQLAAPPPGETLSEIGRAKEAALLAFERVRSTAKGRDDTSFRAAIQALTSAQNSLRQLEREQRRAEIEDGTLLTYEAAHARFLGVIDRLRELLSSLPTVMGPRCNPTDPAHATAALEDWLVNHLHRALRAGTKEIPAP